MKTVANLRTLVSTAPSQAEDVHYSTYHDYRLVPLVDGLIRPCSLAFLPSGDVLVTERPGQLRLARGAALRAQPVRGGEPSGVVRLEPVPRIEACKAHRLAPRRRISVMLTTPL